VTLCMSIRLVILPFFWHETSISKTLLFTQETATFNIAEIPADKRCLCRAPRQRCSWGVSSQWCNRRWRTARAAAWLLEAGARAHPTTATGKTVGAGAGGT